ncbi:universal stress protein [Salinicoccus sediminis]|uniref:Universal stress protein n=1 Tax=Salinicoccus sediminis TaxID=1432562 RepID=A0A0M2SIS7_9STAP|nr:universal stress protein [Salinicoccus sediminis]KKK33541.1 universal stress protein [Salinicoccus sediminis]
MYKTLLFATDGSDNSFRAAKESLNFIDDQTTVTVLNVVTADDVDQEMHTSGLPEGMSSERKERLAKLEKLFSDEGVSYEILFERGVPKETVVNFANSGDYQALILGSRGLNNFQEMVLGSVSHKAAKRAKIPVIIVK